MEIILSLHQLTGLRTAPTIDDHDPTLLYRYAERYDASLPPRHLSYSHQLHRWQALATRATPCTLDPLALETGSGIRASTPKATAR